MRNDEFVEFEENLLLDNKNLAKLTFTQSQEKIIKRLYLSFNQIISLPKDMKELIFIDLSNNKIGSILPDQITEALSSYPSLNQLYLKQNQLENLNSLQSPTLQVFHMTQNRFRQFPDQLFTNFPKLRTLDLDHNFLYTFSNQKSETIRELSLSLNCIETIDLETLNFPQLVSLDLSKNRITKIPNNFSKSFPKLQILYLNDNLITEISEDSDGNDPVFPETLSILNLSNNFIEKVPNSITKIKYLTELYIENNKITHIPKLNGTLRYFRASNNKISSIDDQELNFLIDIVLFNNELKTYPIQFKTIRGNSIRFDRNEIKEISFGNFPINQFLTPLITEINISFNQIETIPKELFENLPNLQTFSAFFNKITEIPSEISNCQNLVNLNISHNPIKKLPKLPKSLKKLTASNCQIESIDHETIPSNIKIIDLSGNNLQSFTSLSSIQILNLSQNKLKEMPSVTENLQILDLSMNQIESKQEFIACFSLVDFNLSYNKLTEIPKICLAQDLKYLELSGNPIKGKLNINNFPLISRIDISNTEIEVVGSNPKFNEIIRSPAKEEEEKEEIDAKENTATPVEASKEKEEEEEEEKEEIDAKENTSTTEAAAAEASKENKVELDDGDDTSDDEEEEEILPTDIQPIYVNQENEYKSGYSETVGMRSNMEDSVIVRDDLNLYAVCDGHGGSDTSKFACIQISELFEKEKENYSFEKASDYVLEKVQKSIELISKMKLKDGSTLCLAFVCTNELDNKRKVVTAHLGDSRALIVRSDGKQRELTKDHKPSVRSEFERIHNEFGCISKKNRLDGVLAVSRSIGDYDVHCVGREPEMNEFDLDENDKFLVICCDGVFDVLTNDDLAQLIVNASSANEAAYKIRNAAFSSLSIDNISAIVVDLQNNNTLI